MAAPAEIQLSPFDLRAMGRSVPMTFFYEGELDPLGLIQALERTLALFPVLSGRYSSRPTGAVTLSNAGVAVQICTAPATATLAGATSHLNTPDATPSIFARTTHEPYSPHKAPFGVPMDPDSGNPEAPLLSIKITTFASGGAAIGILAQHGVVDGDAEIAFMRCWSELFRGLDAPTTPPRHDRCAALEALEVGDEGVPDDGEERPAGMKTQLLPPGEKPQPPAFMALMPKIGGGDVCVAPFGKEALAEMKRSASAGLPDGVFVSTDDVLLAHVWRAQVRVRCAQLSLPEDSDATSTVLRAWNFRGRTDPPLGGGYCANGVDQAATEMAVRDVLSLSVSEVAQRLRATLLALSSRTVAQRFRYLQRQRAAGRHVLGRFDDKGLTFVMSSWLFDWEGADFGARPICFDHGALTPIAVVFTPRPGGDGVNVYSSGSAAGMEHFSRLMAQAHPGPR